MCVYIHTHMYVYTYIYLHKAITTIKIKNVCHSQASLCPFIIHPLPAHVQAIEDLLSEELYFIEFHINGIMSFFLGFFLLLLLYWASNTLFRVSIVHSFLVLSSIPLYGNRALFIYLLMPLFFNFCLLQIKLLWVFGYKSLWSYTFISLG